MIKFPYCLDGCKMRSKYILTCSCYFMSHLILQLNYHCKLTRRHISTKNKHHLYLLFYVFLAGE